VVDAWLGVGVAVLLGCGAVESAEEVVAATVVFIPPAVVVVFTVTDTVGGGVEVSVAGCVTVVTVVSVPILAMLQDTVSAGTPEGSSRLLRRTQRNAEPTGAGTR